MKFDEVFEQELAELRKRRAVQSGDDAGDQPDARGLIGLCFSGGGVRSATFNLGVARGLYRWGLLDAVDYLSTVSGGGFIGGCLSNYYRSGRQHELLGGARKEAKTDETDAHAVESEGVKRLRGFGNYLTPTGSLGEWLEAMLAIMRGVLWNVAIIIVVAVCLATLCSFALTREGQWAFAFPHGIATAVAVGVVVLVMMLSVFSSRVVPGRVLVGLLVLTLCVAAMDVLPTVLDFVAGYTTSMQVTVIGSGAAGLLGSTRAVELPRKAKILVARLLAFLLTLVVPIGLFLLLLLHFTSGPPNLLAKQLATLSSLLVFAFVDYNRTSVHGFYKQRLSAAYLQHVGKDKLAAAPKLSEFAGKPGPLHLINVALNLRSNLDPSVRDRQADFFTLSCLHVGRGRMDDYAPTALLERAHDDFTLASAVAISGAAASPNMGSFTDGLLRPLMVLLNVRLGYWAPNPSKLRAGKRDWTARLPYLVREVVGDVDTEHELVNISDGGHLENLGAFELLRRRCKLIIIGDGGPNMKFDSLAKLIRFARTDLEAEIELDLDDLRPGPDGLSAKQAAIGTVTYADGSVGRILYIKSSLTGHEPPDVRYYRDANPEFPNQSTADQWFDDAQFDAYLGLGEEIVEGLFAQLGYRDPSEVANEAGGSWDQRMAALAVILAPSARSRSHTLTDHFNSLQETLLRDEFKDYQSQLVPTHHVRRIPNERLHLLVPVAMLQLQLMEQAVAELGLVDARNREALANRGWMNLFRRWACSEAFQRMALICVPAFGAQLTQFMNVGLQLGTQYTWFAHPDTANRPNHWLLGERTLEIAGDDGTAQHLLTGYAEIEPRGEDLLVHELLLRAGFEGYDRLEAAMVALRQRFSGQRLVLSEPVATATANLPADSYVRQLATREWTREDEDMLLEFSRSAAVLVPGEAGPEALSFEPPIA